MTRSKVMEAIKSIKVKNCEGPTRTPQRILIDGLEQLAFLCCLNKYFILFDVTLNAIQLMVQEHADIISTM